ncbi:MAG TPA: YibE/F family protein [Desulfosporosinus sp.]|nr:YibE/F family protein [Desulfosporosinus sp.]
MSKGLILDMKEMEVTQGITSLIGERQWLVNVEIKDGPYAGRTLDTIHYYGANPAYDIMVYPGDEVILSLVVENNLLKEANIADYARDKYIKWLFLIFIASILLIGARQGIKTIISLAITGWAVVKILLPAILTGKDPITITIIICSGITIITHMLITGFTKKSLAAISGTTIGIVIGGLLAKYVISLTRITGLASEESRLLFFSFQEGQINITGILFAGIVLGSLGAVMDVAMSIASSTYEIHLANPKLSFKQLVESGLNVGRDIIGTMANTLILAYTGGALPLMLLVLANNIPYLKFINLDMIATEIIRALSGSIGLFIAVPFTALISAALYRHSFRGNSENNP